MRRLLCALLAAAVVAGCGSSSDEAGIEPARSRRPRSEPAAPSEPAPPAESGAADGTEPVQLEVTEVARDLDTVWSLAWDPQGQLWYTERPGRLSRLDGPTTEIEGVVESGEAGLMGLEIDEQGRLFLMYSAADENRVVRLEPDGSQTVLVDGIGLGGIHDGGRIRFGPDGSLFVSTGDTGDSDLAQDPESLSGKILQVDPDTGETSIFSTGHRNAQGLCFAPDGRFYSTEHGPSEGDEINLLTEGLNGGWPEVVGNGLQNYTPTIAPAGCVYYDAELIPQWRGSLLFVTLKDQSLRRLTLGEDGSVTGEEVLIPGRLRPAARRRRRAGRRRLPGDVEPGRARQPGRGRRSHPADRAALLAATAARVAPYSCGGSPERAMSPRTRARAAGSRSSSSERIRPSAASIFSLRCTSLWRTRRPLPASDAPSPSHRSTRRSRIQPSSSATTPPAATARVRTPRSCWSREGAGSLTPPL